MPVLCLNVELFDGIPGVDVARRFDSRNVRVFAEHFERNWAMVLSLLVPIEASMLHVSC
jgi:hypothetical protein